MKSKKLLLMLIFNFVFISCFHYEVVTIPESGQYKNIHRMTGNFIEISKQSVGYYGNLQLASEYRFNQTTQQYEYSLIVSTLAENGLFIQPDTSFELSVTDTTIQLRRRDNPYHRREVTMNHKKYILETAWFDTEKAILKSLGQAKVVRFSIQGKTKTIHGKLSEKNIENFRRFSREYLEAIDEEPLNRTQGM